MKISRPLSILLCFFIFIFSFSLSVSAASDDGNLINPDLTQWDVIDVSSSSSDVLTWNNGELYRFYAKGGSISSDVPLLWQFYYDMGDIIAGHSYTFSFHLPDLADIQDVYNTTMTDEVFKGYYKNATLCIGYGFLSADGSAIQDTYELFEFNSDNINAFVGKDLKTSFVAPSSSGRPCMFILLHADDINSHYFFLQDFRLVDNDDNSKELTGIKGFLHSIRWDLVGGVCEEEDCPHSVSSNPHLSLTERMSAGFQTFFDNLGTAIFNLGESIGNKLNFEFSQSIINVSNGFKDVGSWFSSLGDRISSFFSDLSADISARFSELWNNMFSWLDKFKPRVYFQFNWYRGTLDGITGDFVPSDSNPFVYVTDFFIVRSSDEVFLDTLRFAGSNSMEVTVYKYNLDGTFLTKTSVYPSHDPKKLDSGFKYRFRYSLQAGYDPNVANDYVLVYSDEGWINSLMRCFGNLFLYLSWSEVPANPFERQDDPIDKLQFYSDNLVDYLEDGASNITDVMDSTAGAMEFFTKFTEKYDWLLGILVFVLLLTVWTRFIGL